MVKSPQDYLDRARSSAAMPSELRRLARAEWEFVKEAVARNPITPADVLDRLTSRPVRLADESTVLAIAMRPDAPPEVLGRLTDEVVPLLKPSQLVLAATALCQNERTPLPAIERLLRSAGAGRRFRLSTARTPVRRQRRGRARRRPRGLETRQGRRP